MQRDVISGSRGKGKRGRHEVREKQMPGDKQTRVRDRWREQEHNIRFRWQPGVIFVSFHGCTGVSSMEPSEYYRACNKMGKIFQHLQLHAPVLRTAVGVGGALKVGQEERCDGTRFSKCHFSKR